MNNFVHFIIALLLFFSLNAHAEGAIRQDVSLSDAQLELNQVEPVLKAEPKNLVNYTWKVLYSVNESGFPCTNNRCFRAEDLFFILHNSEAQGQQCDTHFTLLMHDISAGTIKPFPSIGGQLSGCRNPSPASVRFFFLDQINDNSFQCREMTVTPVRINRSPSSDQCLGDLEALSKLSEDNVKRAFGDTCVQDHAVHWRVKDADNSKCGGLNEVVPLSPPEPGQGTASGTQ